MATPPLSFSTADSAIEVIPRGASLISLNCPPAGSDLDQAPTNVILSLPSHQHYSSHPHQHFSRTIGRVTNRIANARLEDLNGQTYKLAANNGPNNLHGGNIGWGARDWTDGGIVRRSLPVQDHERVKEDHWPSKKIGDIRWFGSGNDGKREARQFSIKSPDGEEGFPGDVDARCWYYEGRGADGEVIVEAEWEAELVDPRDGLETVVGMTNHAYFNLNPHSRTTSGSPASLEAHVAALSTPLHLPFLPENPGIPNGTIASHPMVPGKPFVPFSLSADGGILDLDDCFVVNDDPSSIPLDTRPLALRTLATIRGESSGIVLVVESTEPAFQFYTGKYISVPPWTAGYSPQVASDGSSSRVSWEEGAGYGAFSGLCVEPGRYINAAGTPDWRSMCRMKKGQLFGARTRWIVWRD